ncbi:MAG: hypothetical protein WCK35_15820 [Chloroflexota bacterium]
MNCPKCGTPNNASQYYCIECGTALNTKVTENTPVSKTRKFRISKTKLILIAIGAIVFLPQCLFAINAKEYPSFAITLFYSSIGLIPAYWWIRRVNRLLVNASQRDLWLYRIAYVLVSLAAWPVLLFSWLLFWFIFKVRGDKTELDTLKSVVFLSGSLVVMVLVLFVFGQVYTALDTQNRKNNLQAQQQELSALKQKWGDYVGLCAQTQRSNETIPISQIQLSPQMDNTILVVDTSYPHTIVSPWENQLPPNLQATKPDQVAWLVCKSMEESESSCNYEAGTKINYKIQTMTVDVYSTQNQQLIKAWSLTGPHGDTCPDKVHTVNSAIDYVIMKDGSQRSLSELSLDEIVTFEGFYSMLTDAISKASK